MTRSRWISLSGVGAVALALSADSCSSGSGGTSATTGNDGDSGADATRGRHARDAGRGAGLPRLHRRRRDECVLDRLLRRHRDVCPQVTAAGRPARCIVRVLVAHHDGKRASLGHRRDSRRRLHFARGARLPSPFARAPPQSHHECDPRPPRLHLAVADVDKNASATLFDLRVRASRHYERAVRACAQAARRSARASG